MAQVVWKFPLFSSPVTRVRLPLGAKVLSVGFKEGEGPALWVQLDPKTESSTDRDFAMVATGEEFDGTSASFIGTYFVPNTSLGVLVFHVFEVRGEQDGSATD